MAEHPGHIQAEGGVCVGWPKMCPKQEDTFQVLTPPCSWLIFTPRQDWGGKIPPLHICSGEPPVVMAAWIVGLDL